MAAYPAQDSAPLQFHTNVEVEFESNWVSTRDCMGFGESLRAERERRGISLDDISLSTRIAPRHLQALETNQFKELPGGVISRGFVRSYARFVGMDEGETVSQFQNAIRAAGLESEGSATDWAEFAEAVRRNRVRSPQRGLRWAVVAALMLGVLLLLCGVLWYLMHRGILHPPEWLAEKLHLTAAVRPIALPRA